MRCPQRHCGTHPDAHDSTRVLISPGSLCSRTRCPQTPVERGVSHEAHAISARGSQRGVGMSHDASTPMRQCRRPPQAGRRPLTLPRNLQCHVLR